MLVGKFVKVDDKRFLKHLTPPIGYSIVIYRFGDVPLLALKKKGRYCNMIFAVPAKNVSPDGVITEPSSEFLIAQLNDDGTRCWETSRANFTTAPLSSLLDETVKSLVRVESEKEAIKKANQIASVLAIVSLGLLTFALFNTQET